MRSGEIRTVRGPANYSRICSPVMPEHGAGTCTNSATAPRLGGKASPGLSEPNIGATLVYFDPALLYRVGESRVVLDRCRLVAKQKRGVDLLDINPAVLHRLVGAGVLHQPPRRFFRIGIWPVRRQLH